MEERRTTAPWIVVIGMVLIMLPVLYVLSIGPISGVYRNDETPEWVIAFYSPLAWLANHSPLCKDWLLWYISLWI